MLANLKCLTNYLWPKALDVDSFILQSVDTYLLCDLATIMVGVDFDASLSLGKEKGVGFSYFF